MMLREGAFTSFKNNYDNFFFLSISFLIDGTVKGIFGQRRQKSGGKGGYGGGKRYAGIYGHRAGNPVEERYASGYEQKKRTVFINDVLTIMSSISAMFRLRAKR